MIEKPQTEVDKKWNIYDTCYVLLCHDRNLTVAMNSNGKTAKYGRMDMEWMVLSF